MTQFTASEVRERERFEDWYTTHTFNYSRDPIGSRDCSLQWEAWKAALADMLEAREKAVPVATVEDQFGFPIIEWIGDAGDRCPVGTKLHIHPDPADHKTDQKCIASPCIGTGVCAFEHRKTVYDAERLAEALRRTCRKMKTFSRTGALDGAVAVWVDEIESVLAAHSTQAQPPANTERLAELLRGLEIGPMAATLSPKKLFAIGAAIAAQAKEAQAAAASVPDAETLRLHLGELTPDEVCVAKAAYRLALAAQENPNGV